MIDQYSDRSFRVLHQKLKSFPDGTSDLIKTARINYDEADDLPDGSFAWPEMRKYAIHTPQHAALSKIYSEGEKVPEYVQANINRALDIYDVSFPEQEKQAAAEPESPEDYLVPHMRIGKISEGPQVKEASRYFLKNRKRMDMPTRVNAAVTLVKKAQAYGVDLPTSIYKHAGLTCSNRKVLSEWLEVRKDITQDQTIKTAFDKLHNYVSEPKNKISGRRDLLKLADTIHGLDKRAGLVEKYDRTLPDPVVTVFNMNKLAEETVSLAGKDVPVTKLMGLPVETYGDLLGDDIVPEITDQDNNLDQSSLLSVLSTLPADMQIALVRNLGI